MANVRNKQAAAAWAQVTTLVDEFVAEYEMHGESETGLSGVHSPNETERFVIKDAIMGLLADEAFLAALAEVKPIRMSDEATLENILAWVNSRIEAEVAHRPASNVYKRTLSETWNQIRLHLVSLQSEPAGDQWVKWRCFHCNEGFNIEADAALHFGDHERQSPACQIDIAQFRTMEVRMTRYNDEDSEMHRQMSRMQAEHEAALRSAEQTGYDRGLEDAKKHPEELGLTAIASG